MPLRYADLDVASSGARDFIIRRRAPTTPQLLLVLGVTLLLSIGLIVNVMDKVVLAVTLTLVLGALCWYVLLTLQRNRDLVLATEFQNALFASALGINNKFCIIIKRDGNIIYLDRSFQEMFPDFIKQPRHSVDILLEYGRVSRPDSEKIFAAIERGVYEKVVFEIRSSDGKFNKIVMSIEPILRPSGFILLRGREYIEQRAQPSETAFRHAAPLNKSTITLFSYVMDTMNMGVYMTGPAGNLIYANPVLEQWLGFREGEISSNNLSLQDIIHHGNNRVDAIEPDNYEGEVMLQKKPGGTMRVFINQKVIRDDQGKVMGCTALVHTIADTAPDGKRKLW